MAPVEESSESPDGSGGDTLHEVTAPPLEVGVTVVMAVFFVSVRELGLYVTDDGAMSLTTMVTEAVVLPPVLPAVTVYEDEVVMAVGVPLMAPVDESSERPDGSDGETDQDVTGPPLTDGVTVVMAVPFVSVNEFGV